MNIQTIKDKLNSKEYEFLRKDPHLGNNILILTTAGSIAYGTNVDTSDIDIRGVSLETKQDIMGLSSFEQFEDRTTDTVVYGLKKFIYLCVNCNPNVLEILGTKPEHLLYLTKEGQLLRDNVDLFLSRKAIQSFGNYATAQLRRLQNALARDNYPQAEKEQHILNSILGQMDHLKRTYKSFTDSEISLYIDKSAREEMNTEIFIDINLKHYPLRDFKNIYSDINNIVKDYSKLNHRNSKKDELHLNKHAMHLIRLLVTGTEILEGKGINTYREKEFNYNY
jgi:predicted nucleotidyltransferase